MTLLDTGKNLRRIAGRWKCRLVDELPYARKVEQMPAIREALRGELSKLPPVPAPNKPVYEIHMLCGHRDCDMGIWASWSLMRFLEDKAKLIVHSDGTLTPEDISEWSGVIHGAEVVARPVADAEILRQVGHTRHLHRWRSGYKTSPQLIDAHFFGETPVMLVMDSDVLVFSRPTELIEAMERREFVWCNDLRDAYSTTPELMKEVTGIQLPSRFNCGMLVTPRLTLADFEKLDAIMETIHQDGRIDIMRYWACQTYYALLSTFAPGSHVLPETYTTTAGRTGADCVVRHFVGIARVRYRYFTEGVTRLLGQAGVRR